MATEFINASIDDVWKKVSQAIDRLYLLEEISPRSYMELYTQVWNYCKSPPSHGSSIRTPKKATTKSVVNNRQNNLHEGNIHGAELYFKLKDYFKDHLEKICE
ncbi:unnamed protein product, partial [Rotaria sp. Silwood1]